jgi:hypothetical protein
MSFSQHGQCLCGSVKYKITAKPLFVHACHCTSCQKITGTSHWLSMFVLDSDFELLSGELSIVKPPQKYGVAKKHFCAKCGCNIYGTHSYLKHLILPATGTLDDTTWFAPQAHIYVRSKQPWLELTDNTPQFDKLYNREDVWPQESLTRLNTRLALAD